MKSLRMSSDYATMINGAVNAGVSYLEENPNIKSLILGISGGVDSAVIAALARKICDTLLAKSGRKVTLAGYSLKIVSNTKEETTRAENVGKEYCDTFRSASLSNVFLNLLSGVDFPLYTRYTLHKEELLQEEKVRAGNMKARTRMIFLYNQALAQKGIVLSTDNLTEYLLGFWTLHGDVGDLGLIQMLWKTEVYGIANLLGDSVKACAEAMPTDGLGVTNSDIDQLIPTWTPGMGDHKSAYNLIDNVLYDKIEGLGGFSSDNPVVRRYEATHFKRKNPVNIPREMLLWVHNPAM